MKKKFITMLDLDELDIFKIWTEDHRDSYIKLFHDKTYKVTDEQRESYLARARNYNRIADKLLTMMGELET